jgi:hypothetical protein
MATITLSNPTYYQKGVSGVSAVVGNESVNSNRNARFEFTSPSEGASHIEFSIYYGYLIGQSSKKTMRFYIGTSSTSHANAWKDSEYHGEVMATDSGDVTTFTGEADVRLLPNTKYYLWIFPGDTGDGWCYYGVVPNTCTLETTGGVGLVYIDNGTGWDAYQVYIDNGTTWDLYVPYIDNGSSWDLYT